MQRGSSTSPWQNHWHMDMTGYVYSRNRFFHQRYLRGSFCNLGAGTYHWYTVGACSDPAFRISAEKCQIWFQQKMQLFDDCEHLEKSARKKPTAHSWRTVGSTTPKSGAVILCKQNLSLVEICDLLLLLYWYCLTFLGKATWNPCFMYIHVFK